MQDAWRAYLELAMGLTEAPRKRAQDAVRRLVGSGGATAGQIQALAEELVSTGAANREALTKLVRFEVDRALGAVGLATSDEVAELTRRVHELERQLREAKGIPGALTATPAPTAATPDAPAATPAATGATTPGPTTATPGPTGTAAGAGPAVPAPAAAARTGTATPGRAVAKKAVAKKAVARKSAAVVDTTDDAAPAVGPVKRAAPRKSVDGTP